MNNRKDPRRVEQEDRLLEDTLRPQPPLSPGHLSEDDFVLYPMEEASQAEAERIDAHLAACEECAETMERLAFASQEWCGEDGGRRLAALRDRLEQRRTDSDARTREPGRAPGERRTAPMGGFMLLGRVSLGLAATSPAVVSGHTEDGRLRGRQEEDTEKNLLIRLGSNDLELEGSAVRLSAGSWAESVVLARTAPDQVGAEATISRENRLRLPEDAVLRVELLNGDRDTESRPRPQ